METEKIYEALRFEMFSKRVMQHFIFIFMTDDYVFPSMYTPICFSHPDYHKEILMPSVIFCENHFCYYEKSLLMIRFMAKHVHEFSLILSVISAQDTQAIFGNKNLNDFFSKTNYRIVINEVNDQALNAAQIIAEKSNHTSKAR